MIVGPPRHVTSGRRATTLAACTLALVGFAANSLLARGAIGAGSIDPYTYTVVRLASGAALLIPLARLLGEPAGAIHWGSSGALALYALAFSLSYVRIGAALGALVLFPTVKLSLVAWGLFQGERPTRAESLGAALALAGLVTLTLHGRAPADLAGVGLMVVAGMSWAVYTALGRRATAPTATTAINFAGALILASLLIVPALQSGGTTASGLVLAILSGSVGSGVAYTLWYVAVPGLTAMQSGLAQLAVPALAATGAVVLLGEALTGRLLVAGALIFVGVGIGLVNWTRK